MTVTALSLTITVFLLLIHSQFSDQCEISGIVTRTVKIIKIKHN